MHKMHERQSPYLIIVLACILCLTHVQILCEFCEIFLTVSTTDFYFLKLKKTPEDRSREKSESQSWFRGRHMMIMMLMMMTT